MMDNIIRNKLLAFAMLLATACVVNVAKASEKVVVNDLVYEVSLETNTAKVSAAESAEFRAGVEAVEIASEVEYLGVEYPVTTIGEGMFWNFKNLKRIIFPPSIQEIEPSTFIGCPLLEDIQLPYGLNMIPSFSFTGLNSVITFPETVSRIGGYSCIKLAHAPEYDFRNAVSIGSRSFVSCPITELHFSDGIEIGSEAFHSCNELRVIELPEDFRIYDNGAFQGCGALEKVVVQSMIPRKLINSETGDEIDGLVVDTEIGADCALYVPKGSAEAYRNSESWSNFKKIVETDFTGIENTETDYEGVYEIWNISGRCVYVGVSEKEALTVIPPGIYIIRHNGKVEKKVVL